MHLRSFALPLRMTTCRDIFTSCSSGSTIPAVAETWTEVWGDEVGALAPKIFFAVPPKCDIWGGDGGGLTVFVNFDI